MEAALESAFAASARVDLRFHDDQLFALGKKLFARWPSLPRRCRRPRPAARRRRIGREVVWPGIREYSSKLLVFKVSVALLAAGCIVERDTSEQDYRCSIGVTFKPNRPGVNALRPDQAVVRQLFQHMGGPASGARNREDRE